MGRSAARSTAPQAAAAADSSSALAGWEGCRCSGRSARWPDSRRSTRRAPTRAAPPPFPAAEERAGVFALIFTLRAGQLVARAAAVHVVRGVAHPSAALTFAAERRVFRGGAVPPLVALAGDGARTGEREQREQREQRAVLHRFCGVHSSGEERSHRAKTCGEAVVLVKLAKIARGPPECRRASKASRYRRKRC